MEDLPLELPQTSTVFKCILQSSSNTTDNLCLVLSNLEVQHYPIKQNVNFFMPPLNELKQ